MRLCQNTGFDNLKFRLHFLWVPEALSGLGPGKSGHIGDDDLFLGRFKKKPLRSDIEALSAISTADSCALREFLALDLEMYFSNQNDQSLFMKIIAADGIETCL